MPAPVAPWGWLPALVAPVALVGGWTLAAAFRPQRFDPVRQSISALAAAGEPHRWVMTSALVVVGLSHLGTAVALRAAAPPGRFVLAAGGLATIAVAALPLPPAGQPGAGSTPHAAAAGLALVALAAWPALAWRRWPPAAVLTAGAGVTAACILLGLVGWFAVELRQDGARVGLAERVAAGAQALWPLATVAVLKDRRAAVRAG